jgi:hypothetical protein
MLPKLMYVGSNHNLAKIDNEFPIMINDELIPVQSAALILVFGS